MEINRYIYIYEYKTGCDDLNEKGNVYRNTEREISLYIKLVYR